MKAEDFDRKFDRGEDVTADLDIPKARRPGQKALRILEKPASIDWEYDEEADVLYLSVGEPRPAVSVDLGEGIVARYDESENEVVGLTVLGLRSRLVKGLSSKTDGGQVKDE